MQLHRHQSQKLNNKLKSGNFEKSKIVVHDMITNFVNHHNFSSKIKHSLKKYFMNFKYNNVIFYEF
jgi:hypothetical protein